MNIHRLMPTLGLLLVTTAHAAPPRQPTPDGEAVGVRTQAWLDLQRSGNAALAAPRPMPGEVADKVYQRWLDSHGRPIPEQFAREAFAGGSGGR